jgi:hypothetical protein
MGDKVARAEHYRNKAEEVRMIAESMKSTETKLILMDVAADYLMLAEVLDHTYIRDPIPASE